MEKSGNAASSLNRDNQGKGTNNQHVETHRSSASLKLPPTWDQSTVVLCRNSGNREGSASKQGPWRSSPLPSTCLLLSHFIVQPIVLFWEVPHGDILRLHKASILRLALKISLAIDAVRKGKE